MKKVLLIAALLAVFAAACSTSGGAGVASLEDSESISTEQDVVEDSDAEAALAFAECMRENGFPDFEDPVVNADGSVEFMPPPGGGPGAAGEDFEPGAGRQAFQACGDLLDGLAFGPGSGDFDVTEIEDTLVEFAACMRAEGIPFDDPDLSNFGPGGGGDDEDGPGAGPFGGNFDFDDPEFQAAFETCQEEVGLGFRGPGGRDGARFGGGGDG